MNPFTVSRYGQTRFWEVSAADGELVCVCVYKRGAVEVVRRLDTPASEGDFVHEFLAIIGSLKTRKLEVTARADRADQPETKTIPTLPDGHAKD